MGAAIHKPVGISILNDVLGPVMRGPSSSHTAASYHLGRMVASLLGESPAEIVVRFDPAGSYGQVYRQQGVDRGFATGILGLPLTDSRFFSALGEAADRGIRLVFEIVPLQNPDHPNCTDISLRSADGRHLNVRARSTGGGAVEINCIDGWPVLLCGQTHEVVIECAGEATSRIRSGIEHEGGLIGEPEVQSRNGRVLLHFRRSRALEPGLRAAIAGFPEVAWLRESPPIGFVKQGRALFQSAAELIALSADHQGSIARAGLAHEAGLLGISGQQVFGEMALRVDLMCAAVHAGLGEDTPPMQLLTPTAGRIYRADAEGRLAIGGMHTRAAARALAVMHMNSGMGVVCAAPTGGSAGVLPGVLTTLMEECGFDRQQATMAALAAGAIGVVVAARATFAAEIAGCQVEIGAASAMAAAAVVEATGGTPVQAADAAAITFQNTMGLVCDLVQGMVEIPCHTRNAVAASSAFVCADLAMGGYVNPIPLDETIDAVLAVGKMLPCELRVTSLGGLAVTPSALKLQLRK